MGRHRGLGVRAEAQGDRCMPVVVWGLDRGVGRAGAELSSNTLLCFIHSLG